PWNWETFPQYLDALEQRCADVDFAAQLPHSPLRVYVMGERGADLAPPSDDELAQMRRLVAEAVRAGALGVSTSRQLAHRFRSGVSAPSVRTEVDEIRALAAGLKDAGAGIFQIISNTEHDPRSEFEIFRSLVVASGGRPLSFSLPGGPGRDAYVDELARARAEGMPMRAQFMPRPVGMLFGLDLSYHPFALNPSYRPIADLPLAEKVEAMRDPALRARLIAEQPDDPNPFLTSMVKRTQALYPLGDPPNYTPAPEENLAVLAEAAGIPLREMIYDALLERDGHAILYCPLGDPSVNPTPVIQSSGVVIGLGDGGAHYGMICDAAYTTYVLTRLTRDAAAGEGLALPAAIRALTLEPAELVGLLDRGRIGLGMKADVNIIDYQGLKLHAPQVARDLPAGGKRLSQRSDGYRMTMVSGEITYRDGEATGALPGRLVRGAKDAPHSGVGTSRQQASAAA
ncbi:MAG: amidohydrolase, partial [Phenylobacterium sp.]|nr:amidohydrolase [Phenylobacterium sp.]